MKGFEPITKNALNLVLSKKYCLVKSKIGICRNNAFVNICGNKENIGNHDLLLFSSMFSSLSNAIYIINFKPGLIMNV